VRLLLATIALVGLARAGMPSLSALQAGPVNSAPEVAIKAAVIANFPKFVEWPAAAFESKTAPFVVGILGDDQLAAAIGAVFKDKRLGDRPVTVTRASRIEDLQACHMLYVGASEDRRLEQLLGQLDRKPMLTIGDFGRFTQRGGMIGLVVQGDKVRFEINDRAARAAGVRLNANLLRLATAVIS